MKLKLNPASIKKWDNIVVMGTSAGGIMALKEIFSMLVKPLSCPIVVVLHRLKNVQNRLEDVLQPVTAIPIKEAEDKETLMANTIYLAPSNYHLLVERNHTLSLSVSEKVNFSRPSIDVTFISVAEAYHHQAMGIVLTGANHDGAGGLQQIARNGGEAIVQNREEAHISVMPASAKLSTPSAKELTLSEIGKYISTRFGL